MTAEEKDFDETFQGSLLTGIFDEANNLRRFPTYM